jgi:hypothetical protein
MSTNLKSLLKGLRNTECKKGTPPVRPPILYVSVSPLDLHEKQETEQIKFKLLNGTKFQISTYWTGNNEEYLVHVFAVLHLAEQKWTAAEVKEAFAALVAVRKEMSPLFEFPDNKTGAEKEYKKRSSTNSRKRPQGQERLCCCRGPEGLWAVPLLHCRWGTNAMG